MRAGINKIEKMADIYEGCTKVAAGPLFVIPIIGYGVTWSTLAIAAWVSGMLAGHARTQAWKELQDLKTVLSELVEYVNKELPSGQDWGDLEQHKKPINDFLDKARIVLTNADAVTNPPQKPGLEYLKQVDLFINTGYDLISSLADLRTRMTDMQSWFAKYIGGAAQFVTGFFTGGLIDATDLASIERRIPAVQNSLGVVLENLKGKVERLKKAAEQQEQQMAAPSVGGLPLELGEVKL